MSDILKSSGKLPLLTAAISLIPASAFSNFPEDTNQRGDSGTNLLNIEKTSAFNSISRITKIVQK